MGGFLVIFSCRYSGICHIKALPSLPITIPHALRDMTTELHDRTVDATVLVPLLPVTPGEAVLYLLLDTPAEPRLD